MGYTHYWETKRAFTEKEWKKFQAGVSNIVKKSNVSICNGHGEGNCPTINGNIVSLNGDKSLNEGYESFCILKGAHEDFCKTQHRPYDKVVCACLLLMRDILGDDCEIDSDGYINGDDWKEGHSLFHEAIR